MIRSMIAWPFFCCMLICVFSFCCQPVPWHSAMVIILGESPASNDSSMFFWANPNKCKPEDLTHPAVFPILPTSLFGNLKSWQRWRHPRPLSWTAEWPPAARGLRKITECCCVWYCLMFYWKKRCCFAGFDKNHRMLFSSWVAMGRCHRSTSTILTAEQRGCHVAWAWKFPAWLTLQPMSIATLPAASKESSQTWISRLDSLTSWEGLDRLVDS